MTIQEFRDLSNDNLKNVLRLPYNLNDDNDYEREYKLNVSSIIINFLLAYTSVDADLNVLELKKILINNFNLKGNGSLNSLYSVKTQFGGGQFCDLHNFFSNNRYPNFIQKQYCHSNCYDMVKYCKLKCKILSGIACRSYSFLHSVLLVDDYILDFNYDLLMSKDLYMQLFNFEVLSIVDSDDLISNLVSFNGEDKFFKNNNITYGEVCFCYYEILDIVSKKKNIVK